MPHLNRNALLDWFDGFDASEYSAAQLIDAYNALTGESARLVCGHCGYTSCIGRIDIRKCAWRDIHNCRECGKSWCDCAVEFARNE